MKQAYDFGPSIKFHPWIGENYKNPRGSLFSGGGRRLLVLGESHYAKPDENHPEFTEKVIREFVFSGSRKRFFTGIGQALAGCARDEMGEDAFKAHWHDIAFYNYIQELVGEAARIRPTQPMWQDAFKPFLEIVETLRPTDIWVCGVGLWNNMPYEKDGASFEDGPPPLGNPNEFNSGTYGFKKKRYRVFQSYHPSSSKFQWQNVHDYMKKALNQPL